MYQFIESLFFHDLANKNKTSGTSAKACIQYLVRAADNYLRLEDIAVTLVCSGNKFLSLTPRDSRRLEKRTDMKSGRPDTELASRTHPLKKKNGCLPDEEHKVVKTVVDYKSASKVRSAVSCRVRNRRTKDKCSEENFSAVERTRFKTE